MSNNKKNVIRFYKAVISKAFYYPACVIEEGRSIEDVHEKAIIDFTEKVAEDPRFLYNGDVVLESVEPFTLSDRKLESKEKMGKGTHFDQVLKELALADVEEKFGKLDPEKNPELFIKRDTIFKKSPSFDKLVEATRAYVTTKSSSSKPSYRPSDYIQPPSYTQAMERIRMSNPTGNIEQSADVNQVGGTRRTNMFDSNQPSIAPTQPERVVEQLAVEPNFLDDEGEPELDLHGPVTESYEINFRLAPKVQLFYDERYERYFNVLRSRIL